MRDAFPPYNCDDSRRQPRSRTPVSPRHRRIRATGGKRGHEPEREVARTIPPLEKPLLLAAHDREGAEHVLGCLAVESVQMKEHRVEPRASAQPILLVPRERRAGVSLVARETRHVVGDVGEVEHVVADDLLRRLRPKSAREGGGRDDGELSIKYQVRWFPCTFWRATKSSAKEFIIAAINGA